MSATVTAAATTRTGQRVHAQSEYVTFRLADQWIGIPVMIVQEVLVPQRIAHVPMAPEAIAGFLNLRGQIVTAVNLRTTLRLPARADGEDYMNVVVRQDGELFAFMVDEVGDVVSVDDVAVEPVPTTLDERWRSASLGIVRREAGLLVVMDVRELLRLENTSG
jgi:purine-binding chemotaxis protein CheW